jgi:hypothetical protein
VIGPAIATDADFMIWLHLVTIHAITLCFVIHVVNVRNDQPPWKEVDVHEEFRVWKQIETNDIIKQFQLQEVPIGNIRLIDIDREYQLKELTEEIKSEFKVGRSFYEFKDKLEAIPEQSEIIFMDEVMTVPMCNVRFYALFNLCSKQENSLPQISPP